MPLTDTHCHIHESNYEDQLGAYQRAMAAGVERLICVGTDEASSEEAVKFANQYDNAWAAIGLHPHDAKNGLKAIDNLKKLLQNSQYSPKIVAIGECGLDFFYNNSPPEMQFDILHAQLELAKDYGLPVTFHVREAFDDFWPIFDQYPGITGVIHSFTDDMSNLEQALKRDLAIGVNGIATFAKDRQEVYQQIPPEKMCLETDAPFLTPMPYRGKVNEPALLTLVANHIANLQSIDLEELSQATERCANQIFKFS